MTSLKAGCLALALASAISSDALAQGDNTPLVFPGANSRPTYFTMHEVAGAWKSNRGGGIRVGILDHGFGFTEHRELYTGGVDFLDNGALSAYAEHGYWMALVLREIAPEVAIFALNTASRDEKQKVDAMVHAIDWAIENDIDILTYSAQRFTMANRAALDDAVDRATQAGVVIVFIHYPHPDNLLPTGLFGRSGDDEREPDVHILHYDYSVLFPEWYREHQKGNPRPGWSPFLSMSSTSPVTAGIVAMMLSANPELTPEQCKAILQTTSRPMEFEARTVPRVVNAATAVMEAQRRRDLSASPDPG